MQRLVVDAQTSCGASGGEVVDRDPGEDLVVGPGVSVRPVVQLFVDPGEQADGTVSEGIAEGLGFGALLQSVPAAFF